MIRRDISLTIALCASLALHGFLIGSAAEMFTRDMSQHLWQPGFPRLLVATIEDEDPKDRLGSSTGIGNALAESPGALPMQAPKAHQIQPWLGLDPQSPGHLGDSQNDSALQPAQTSTPAPPPSPPPSPFGVNTSASDFSNPYTAQNQSTAQQQSAAQQQSQPSSPAQASAAGNPVPQADTESDPTTIAGAADFRAGSTNVRLGRDYKLTRPHLSLAAQADLVTLASPIVVLKIHIDETGHVTSAEVYRSSGSNNVDEPCKLAAYNWWFEPAKDKSGKAVKDVILFALRFI